MLYIRSECCAADILDVLSSSYVSAIKQLENVCVQNGNAGLESLQLITCTCRTGGERWGKVESRLIVMVCAMSHLIGSLKSLLYLITSPTKIPHTQSSARISSIQFDDLSIARQNQHNDNTTHCRSVANILESTWKLQLANRFLQFADSQNV
jgi:hypothetical protein